MCLHATKPSFLSLERPNIYAAEAWALTTAEEKGAPSNLGSRASKSPDLAGDLPIFDQIMKKSPDLPLWNENLPIYYKKL